MTVNRISSSVQHPQEYFDPTSEFSQQQQATFQEQFCRLHLDFQIREELSQKISRSRWLSIILTTHLFYKRHQSPALLGSQLTRNHCLPNGHFSQRVVPPAQHWPHCTALRSILTCCLWHLHLRKSSVSSHSLYINTALWRFLLSSVPQLKQINCLIKYNPLFLLVLTSCIYLLVSTILLLQAPSWGTEWLYWYPLTLDIVLLQCTSTWKGNIKAWAGGILTDIDSKEH